MTSRTRVLVTGAGGFIGHHLVSHLVDRGYWVRGVDVKLPQYESTAAHEFESLDLRSWENCVKATRGVDEVYGLAANLGRIWLSGANTAAIVRDNTLMNLHTIEAARVNGVKRYLHASSACVYPGYRQGEAHPPKEEDAYPANPEDAYGWEKLYMERVCRHYREDFGLETRVARLHCIFGPLDAYDGGREKPPAAICRQVALAQNGDDIEVWGDGGQMRSYCYIDDCIEGIYRLMRSNFAEPLNLGQDRMSSLTELVDIVAGIAAKHVCRRHDLARPQGERVRNSDYTRLLEVLGWEAQIPLEEGLARTYRWIEGELRKEGRLSARSPAVSRATPVAATA